MATMPEEKLCVAGIGRAQAEQVLEVYFTRRPTNEEMSAIHSVIRAYASSDGTPRTDALLQAQAAHPFTFNLTKSEKEEFSTILAAVVGLARELERELAKAKTNATNDAPKIPVLIPRILTQALCLLDGELRGISLPPDMSMRRNRICDGLKAALKIAAPALYGDGPPKVAPHGDAERFAYICDMETEDDMPFPLYEAWSVGPEAFRAAIDKAMGVTSEEQKP